MNALLLGSVVLAPFVFLHPIFCLFHLVLSLHLLATKKQAESCLSEFRLKKRRDDHWSRPVVTQPCRVPSGAPSQLAEETLLHFSQLTFCKRLLLLLLLHEEQLAALSRGAWCCLLFLWALKGAKKEANEQNKDINKQTLSKEINE